MFSYFSTVSKAQETKAHNIHYEERLKEFVANFSVALPKLAIAKINDVARHKGVRETTINIVKLAEEFHLTHTTLYQKYYIALNESSFKEMIISLKEYLKNEQYEVTEEIKAEGVVELKVSWAKV